MMAYPPRIAALLFSGIMAWTAAAAEPALEWQSLYDGGGLVLDMGVAAVTDPAGNLVIAGESVDALGGVDMIIHKLDRSTGDTLWTRRVPSLDGNDMAVGGMVWDHAGHLLIGGTRLGCFG
ncbi:MAG: hypothetical protein ABIK65_08800 [Candidatus Eisenbacteria bacterium]